MDFTRIIPPHNDASIDAEEHCKKNTSDVDNCVAFSEKRYQMICQIQNFLEEGCSYREIAKRMRIGRNTIAKYRKGDPKEFIMDCLKVGWSKSKTVKAIYEKGYSGSKSNAFDYLCKIE